MEAPHCLIRNENGRLEAIECRVRSPAMHRLITYFPFSHICFQDISCGELQPGASRIRCPTWVPNCWLKAGVERTKRRFPFLIKLAICFQPYRPRLSGRLRLAHMYGSIFQDANVLTSSLSSTVLPGLGEKNPAKQRMSHNWPNIWEDRGKLAQTQLKFDP